MVADSWGEGVVRMFGVMVGPEVGSSVDEISCKEVWPGRGVVDCWGGFPGVGVGVGVGLGSSKRPGGGSEVGSGVVETVSVGEITAELVDSRAKI